MRPSVKQKPIEKPKVAAPKATAPLTPGRPVRLTNNSAPAGPPKVAAQGLKRPQQQAPLTPGPGGAAHGQRIQPAKRAIQEQREEDEEVDTGPRPKPGAPLPPGKPPPLKHQIESYFSEQGLKGDVYLRDLIDASPGGWVDVEEILSLKRIKALRATKDDVVHALSTGNTWLEVFESEDGISAAVRRPENRPVPQVQRGIPSRAAAREPQERSDQARGPKLNKRPTEPIRPAKAGGQSQLRSQVTGRMLFPGRLSGTLSSYDEESGNATITCAQTEALFEKDVILTWQELEKAGIAISIGSLVSFMVGLGPHGDPEARDLKLRMPEDEEEYEEEYAEESRPAKRQRLAEPEEATLGSRYTGTFKSYNRIVNIGLIACKETHTTFGRDVAVDKEECAGFAPGDAISFELAVDEMGTPKAVNLEAPEEAEENSESVPPTAKSARTTPRLPGRAPPKVPNASSRPKTPPRSGPYVTPLAPRLASRPSAPGKAPASGKAAGIPGSRPTMLAPAGKAPRPANGRLQNGNAQAKSPVKLVSKGGAKAPAKSGSVRQSPIAKAPSGPPPKASMQRSPSTPPVSLSGRWRGVVKSFVNALGSGRISFTGKRPMPNKSEVIVTEAELTGFVVGDAVSFSLEKELSGSGVLRAVELEADDVA